MPISLKHLLSSFFLPTPKLFPLPCTQIYFSLSIFYTVFFFALEFEDGISGTQRGYIIFCRPLQRLPGSLCFSSPDHPLLSSLPDVLPCHFDGSAGHRTISLMTWSQSQQSSLTKTHKLERLDVCRFEKKCSK